ncbi:hypothetical protein RRG08_061599 [Elysia crispata]|uniref:Uncharacterized protein n=1 Tax=Elysia crispata TaxID=231223 RepID=A0AAE1D401_9GAST|nr:hypothetical protein RRG08_061599 [Elysia crispata]
MKEARSQLQLSNLQWRNDNLNLVQCTCQAIQHPAWAHSCKERPTTWRLDTRGLSTPMPEQALTNSSLRRRCVEEHFLWKPDRRCEWLSRSISRDRQALGEQADGWGEKET